MHIVISGFTLKRANSPGIVKIMSEVLRAPWLLQLILEDLSNKSTPETGLNHLHHTSKLVQILQVQRIYILVRLDKNLNFIFLVYEE